MAEESKAVEERKALIQWILDEIWHDGKWELIDQYYTQDFHFRRPPQPDILTLQEYKDAMIAFLQAFPDVNYTIEDLIVEGDKDVMLYSFVGTHSQDSPTVGPATNKKVEFGGIVITYWGKEGKRTDEWHYADHMTFLRKLGYIK